jgi:hypothetical protein
LIHKWIAFLMILSSLCQGLGIAFHAATDSKEEDCEAVARMDEIHKVLFCLLSFSQDGFCHIYFLSDCIFLI